GENAAPESERAGKSLGQREGDIRAEHIERAMGEIDDPHHAEDDRQPRRDQKQRRCAGKTGQELNEVKGHLRSVRMVSGRLVPRWRLQSKLDRSGTVEPSPSS